jgi:hypothetical protein
MKRLLLLAVFVLLVQAPRVSLSQSGPMSASAIGAGAHGYDFMIGTWSCTNTMPSPIGGPASSSWIIGRSPIANTFSYHLSGKDFDAVGYILYDPKAKTWWVTDAFPSGDYSAESTRGTGKTIVFLGPYFTAASKFSTSQIRDTLTFTGFTKVTDVGASLNGGTWKTTYTNSCTKS